MEKLNIEFLADHPEAIPILKELFETEWEPYYGPKGPGDAKSDIIKSSNRHELPIALVGIIDGKICGTAALKMESVTTYPDFYPWLAALLVVPDYRNTGIGEKLIASIEALAKRLGYIKIYVGTGEKSGMSIATLNKRNWKYVNKNIYFAYETSIYMKSL